MLSYIYLGVILLICIIVPVIGMHIEAHYFNKGKCKRCGHDLSISGYDTYGNRNYTCNKCGYSIWVSYDTVDKDWIQHHY